MNWLAAVPSKTMGHTIHVGNETLIKSENIVTIILKRNISHQLKLPLNYAIGSMIARSLMLLNGYGPASSWFHGDLI